MISMKRQLSHANTGKEITSYLAAKMLLQASAALQCAIVARGTQFRAMYMDKSYLHSVHEEADTNLTLHAVDSKG